MFTWKEGMIDELCVDSTSEGMVLWNCVSFLVDSETECIFDDKVFNEKDGITL